MKTQKKASTIEVSPIKIGDKLLMVDKLGIIFQLTPSGVWDQIPKKEVIKYLQYTQNTLSIISAQEEKIKRLLTENNLLFDYADCKMVEGCEEATRLIDKIIQQK